MSLQAYPITTAQLSGNFCETLFYGIYLVTFCFCVQDLLLRGSGSNERWVYWSEIRWLMLCIAVTFFVVNTFDVALGLLHNYNAFLIASDPTVELLDITDWINIARVLTQILTMLLGDFVLIYRCWIVYARRRVMVMPSVILFLGSIAVAIKMIHEELRTRHAASFTQGEFRSWSTSFFCIITIQNILTTCILIWRIWSVDRQIDKYTDHSSTVYQPRHLRRVIRVIAESGGTYTLFALVTFLVNVSSQSLVIYPMTNMTLQSAGIAFNVILVRSSARRDQQFTEYGRETLSHITFRRTTQPAESTCHGQDPEVNRDSIVILEQEKAYSEHMKVNSATI